MYFSIDILMRMHNHFGVVFLKGLDPALPLAMLINPFRLSTDAADFVDIIHTDGGVLGYPWPLGHADFYPNQGIPLQPGCAKQELSKNRWYSVICKLNKQTNQPKKMAQNHSFTIIHFFSNASLPRIE